MGAPTVYRWDDGNAPIANGTQTSLVNILKACLVNGYGTKPAAGWTLEFINLEGTRAAFRNQGTGMFLRVDGTYSTNNVHYIQGYESMSSEVDGLFPFNSNTNSHMSTSATADTTPRPWILIADSRCFYLVCWQGKTAVLSSTHEAASMFFGDIISLYPDDTWGCALINNGHAVNGSYLPCSMGPGVAITTDHYMARNLAGTDAVFQFGKNSGGGPYSDIWGGGGVSRAYGNIIVSRPYVNNGVAYSMRGWMPGLYAPCHPYTDFANFEVLPVGELSLLVIRLFYFTTPSIMLIDISENFRP